ncbi:ATP-dependent Clp protease ATP-binding subunit [Bacillus haynesii]|uniref:Clp protease N-terminal domain-containing protein n=1 Tax=Bacillus haynesii TaxID=1925021 RepID=UPI002281C4E4|nr:ATP-dependent Clp protease ATP-binding subunit [Bacillus haynesii]MCY9387088.1 ATP-dependent Clp protease ATP-binding subunit [Bacillus haynesii]
MIIYNFNSDSLEVLDSAKQFAKSLGHPQIGTEHILLAIVNKEDSAGYRILRLLGIKMEDLDKEIRRLVGHNWITNKKSLDFSPTSEELFETALEEARIDNTAIGTDHLVYGMVNQKKGLASKLLKDYNVNMSRIKSGIRNKQEIKPVEKKQETPHLNSLTVDLTQMARKNQIDPLIGRTEETENLIRTLIRRKKNNPVLLGDPGVGKTALVEGLAYKINNGDVPKRLLNTRLLSLNIGTLVAGTRYRGEFEEKLNNILEELKKSNNVILFIDEVHTIVGAGGAEGSLDAANILKPSLARGEILCIGATTVEEYRKYIETDPALERRFQPILVGEPSQEETLEILKGLKPKYEEHHEVTIEDHVLKKAIEYAVKFIPDRFLPDKAIDLIDEASALVCIESGEHSPVNEENVKKVLSAKTGISIQELSEKQEKDIEVIKSKLSAEFKRQDNVINKVAQVLKRSYVGLNKPEKPLASLLFYGKENTGKKTFSKLLSKVLYEDEKRYLYIDLNKIAPPQMKLEIIGNTTGHLGFEKRGLVLRQIFDRPLSVIVFDNFDPNDKESVEVIDYFMSNNEIEDIQERKLDISHSIFITIHNIKSNHIGFSDKHPERSQDYNTLIKGFPQNFLSNYDELIYFKPLENEDQLEIIINSIRKFEKELLKEGFLIAIDENVIQSTIADFSSINIKEVGGEIQTKIRNKIAEEFMNKNLQKGMKYKIISNDEKLLIQKVGVKGEGQSLHGIH